MKSVVRMCFPHKTASMFAHRLLGALSAANSARHFSINNRPPDSDQAGAYILSSEDPFVFVGPARTYAPSKAILNSISDEDEILEVCQVRDPLDTIVSQFFSHGWIHPDNKWGKATVEVRERVSSGNISVYEYCHMALRGEAKFGGDSVLVKFPQLTAKAKNSRRLIVFYEEFYSDYKSWAKKIADFLPQALDVLPVLLSIAPDYSKTIRLGEDEFFADPLDYVEKHGVKQGKHVRSAAPGDHKHFLTSFEISELRTMITTACPLVGELYWNE